MMVQDIMIKDVIFIDEATSIKEAFDKMEHHRIRHLPVVNKEMEIIGILSDRDIRKASPSILEDWRYELLDRPVNEIMNKNVITALPFDFVEEAANTMMEHQISCLPIEDNGQLIGIITDTDLLKTLVKLTGADMPSSRLEIEVPNESGMLSEVASLIKKHNINIQSVLVYPGKELDKKILVFRLQTMNLRPLTQSIKNIGYKVLWPDLEMKI
ncbi:acetoin utilization protein AcuB [Evansella vedderi]|uniref:Acetoin utilization protein AcuB n=1 Tax=Evansella vedderi TaxID=38282 RepID=A0ABT9ZVM7_9BACI|nr:acetoin utilization AcuB family protein [Evansella vedderi]MDQ0255005.1 acetoin utilization protein AcuB [Evansella vedderi]